MLCACTFSLWLGVRASAVKMQEHLDEMEASRCGQFVVVVKRAGILVFLGLCFNFTKELSREKNLYSFCFQVQKLYLVHVTKKANVPLDLTFSWQNLKPFRIVKNTASVISF